MAVSFVLNGEEIIVEGVDPTTTLSQWLRATGRTGTKEGCAEGDCGACTVIASDVDAHGSPAWRSLNSCITLLPMLDGREVRTVEGLASAQGLHPVQAALVRHGGSQCGYCTPGFVMSMAEHYECGLDDSPASVCSSLDGNICRCTGYRPIREALREAIRFRDGKAHELVGIGKRPPTPPALPALRPLDVAEATRFRRPIHLRELLALRAQHPNARLIAGATEIGVEIRKKMAEPPLLISTEGVSELRRVDETDAAWIVGGAATLTQMDEVLARSTNEVARGIRKMIRVFASRPIRNRATLAGNVVTASPIGDMPPVLLALDAIVVAASEAGGEREIPVERFFTAYRRTALRADEVVVRILIPKPPGTVRFDTYKVSKRRDLDISIVAAALRADLDEGGVVTAARLAFGGVAAMPVRVHKAETLLVGRRLADEMTIRDVATALQSEITPIDDVRSNKEYRRGVAATLFEKFVRGAQSDAMDAPPAFEDEGPWRVDNRSRALAHDSAKGHVTGGALFVDDAAHRRPMLEIWPVTVPHARAKIVRRDASRARAMTGVAAVLFAEDIPGENDVGAIRKDEVLLAKDEVKFHGHPVAVVVAETLEQARKAAKEVVVEVEPLPAIVGIPAAIAANSFHTEPHVIARGEAEVGLLRAAVRMTGETVIGGQEHFYLETHAAYAERGEDDEIHVSSSTQHPSEVQAIVSHVLHLPRHKVIVSSPRMGGGFGGKETQGNTWAALVSLAAFHTKRPVRVQLDRDVDMQLSGKRHPFQATWDVGFDEEGRIHGLKVSLVSDGGWALDLSESIMDRALFHLDNCYWLPNVRFEGRVAKTNVTSHTAFRGFGGPQGMLVIEDILARIAGRLGLRPEEVRERNFYAPSGQTTPYGQPVDDHRVPRMWKALLESAHFVERRAVVDAFNARSPYVKRGLAVTPVKFGISFTASFLNQAGALVHIYRDGSVQVNHGGTEMGQGLHAKIAGIAMRELGIGAESVRVMKTQTDKVPNTSATAASSGADLNGAAVKAACEILRARLADVAARLFTQRGGPTRAEEVIFLGGFARNGALSGSFQISFKEIVEAAYMQQVQLSASGFYRTPDIHYDKSAGRGKPFHYYAYGVAVSEVELDGLSGMKKVRRVDILHDVGDSLNPAIDRGQIEGAFVQGVGWLTSEELKWDAAGKLLTHSASTYQVPSIFDAPEIFKVELLREDAAQRTVVHGSKAVGEPPLMLALSVREALRDAVGAFGGVGEVDLPSPLTHEQLWKAVQQRRKNAVVRAASLRQGAAAE